ncbi:MAG: MgtC/SapB family protein [Candidatus Eremiobacteraeota bacterium]|nr:MgtC/SapB family protein [Candidatus Eremiobacteraeota bacterium]
MLEVFTLRVVIALLLGVAIGVERQWRQRMAGLRTNALVSVGAALFASISILMDAKQNPTQVAAYVVSGIGFLAGAVIFKEGFSVRGLNTAATLWATAAVGTLCGSGFLGEAAIGAVAIVSANVLLRPIVARINRQPLDQTELSQAYEITVVCAGQHEETVRALVLGQIRATTLILRSLESHNIENERVQVNALVVTAMRADAKLEKIVGYLSLDPKILAASWRVAPGVHQEDTVEE